MPGGREEMGESGRAHSAAPPSRFHETAASPTGQRIIKAITGARRRCEIMSRAKINERVAAIIAKRASGRKSPRTEVRNMKYATGSHAIAASSQPFVLRHSALNAPDIAAMPSNGVTIPQTAKGQ